MKTDESEFWSFWLDLASIIQWLCFSIRTCVLNEFFAFGQLDDTYRNCRGLLCVSTYSEDPARNFISRNNWKDERGLDRRSIIWMIDNCSNFRSNWEIANSPDLTLRWVNCHEIYFCLIQWMIPRMTHAYNPIFLSTSLCCYLHLLSLARWI